MIKDTLSDTVHVISGTPQGAICSPLLFLIYINDLPDHTPAPVKCLLVADDAKLSREIISMADCFQLQKMFFKLLPYGHFLQLTFNIKYHYHLNNTALESTELVKGLGVKISKELTYHQHIKEINIVCC